MSCALKRLGEMALTFVETKREFMISLSVSLGVSCPEPGSRIARPRQAWACKVSIGSYNSGVESIYLDLQYLCAANTTNSRRKWR